jgi:riboflavin biosynthesis pyrimidine reductase
MRWTGSTSTFRSSRRTDAARTIGGVTPHRVDRLWPDPASDLDLDAAFEELALPPAPEGRPLVAINMVTTVDGRAQVGGKADALSSRADRRLMRLLRAAFDAVGSGVGTLRADDFYSRVPEDLADRRIAAGRPAQPTALLIAGRAPVPTDRRWFTYAEQPRVVVVGSDSPHAPRDGEEAEVPLPVETWVAPTELPEAPWLLERLTAAGVRSLLLEGGPTTNASFLAADALDEAFWTIDASLVGSDALPMIAPVPNGSPWADAPRPGRLVSVHRSGEELFLRYRFESAGP